MRTVGLLSWEAGSGQNTVAVNLAIGLTRLGRRVILVNLNPSMRVYNWLKTDASGDKLSFNQIYSSDSGVDFIYPAVGSDINPATLPYDYSILNIGGNEDAFCGQGIPCSDLLIACTRLRSPDECARMIELQARVKDNRPDGQGFDLILPLQIHSGEWETNSRRMFELMDVFGEEKMVDFLPHCERIHDLFTQKQSVWKIPQPAIIDAFDRMVDRVELWFKHHPE